MGALTLDNTDTELITTIHESFKIAEEKNVAVVFHVDDSMFWLNRPDLWSDPSNVEWSGWNGPVVPHRYVSWAETITLAPQMCYTSPTLRTEIQRIAKDVIGAEIKKGIDTLIAHNNEQLFAGVIAGWETNLMDYRYIDPTDVSANNLGLPRVRMGYNALSNLGYSATNPPANFDSTLERVVHDWADFWAMNLQSAGIDSNRIYTHIAVPTPPGGLQQHLVNVSIQLGFQADSIGFSAHAMPYTAFNNHSRPGFSTYPSGFIVNGVEGVLARILGERQKHGNPRWADAESDFTDTSAMAWDKYLFDRFNNGASIVNIFGWPFPANSGNPYGMATHSKGAIATYNKFLCGVTGINWKNRSY